MQPRVKEPESALIAGMSARAPQLTADGRLGVEALDMPDTSGPGAVAAPSPAHWVYDFDPASGSSRATYNGEVSFTSGGSATAGVTTWNTRTGAVTLTLADVTGVGGAPSNSPTFINPNANTPAPGDATTKVATTLVRHRRHQQRRRRLDLQRAVRRNHADHRRRDRSRGSPDRLARLHRDADDAHRRPRRRLVRDRLDHVRQQRAGQRRGDDVERAQGRGQSHPIGRAKRRRRSHRFAHLHRSPDRADADNRRRDDASWQARRL